MEYPVSHIIAALFYPGIQIANGANFASAFIERTGDALNHEPVVLPIQQRMPADAPRIVLRSRDARFTCEVSLSRVNFHFVNRAADTVTLAGLTPQLRDLLYRVISALDDLIEAPPNRLGFVARLTRAVEGDVNAAIMDAYLRHDDMEEAAEARLDFLHHIDVESEQCNRWLRLRGPGPGAKNWPGNVALCEVDINTPSDKLRDRTPQEAMTFYLETIEQARRESSRLLARLDGGDDAGGDDDDD